MENYHFVGEIGQGPHSVVYKARRKGGIEYVAIKSTAKSRLEKILNEVQFLRALDSSYILKFYDIYQSDNHILLIFEYCIGGDLLNLITQDKKLPYLTVQKFGYDILQGLYYLHRKGILYCDLKPANILIDDFGTLKLADFGLARRIPSKKQGLFTNKIAGSPNYMSPELFQQPALHSYASDFWAFGCTLFELCTGKQAFTSSTFTTLAHKIQHEELVLSSISIEYNMPVSFWNLLQELIVKNPHERISWENLVVHPFWEGLPLMEIEELPYQEVFEYSRRLSLEAQQHQIASVCNRSNTNLEVEINDKDNPHHSQPSPLSSKTISRDSSQNSISSDSSQSISNSNNEDCEEETNYVGVVEQKNAFRSNADDRVQSVNNSNDLLNEYNLHSETENDINPAENQETGIEKNEQQITLRQSKHDSLNVGKAKKIRISRFVVLPVEQQVTPIIFNEEEHVLDPTALDFECHSPEALVNFQVEALENHMKTIYVSLKSPSAQISFKINVLAYLGKLAQTPKLADVIVNSSLLRLLTVMLISIPQTPSQIQAQAPVLPQKPYIIAAICRVLGIVFRTANLISKTAEPHLQALMSTLIQVCEQEVIQVYPEPQNFSLNVKQEAICAFGQLVYKISTKYEGNTITDGVRYLVCCFGQKLSNNFLGSEVIIKQHIALLTYRNLLIGCRRTMLKEVLNQQVATKILESWLYTIDFTGEDCPMYCKLLVAASQALFQCLYHIHNNPSTLDNVSSSELLLIMVRSRTSIEKLWQRTQLFKTSQNLAATLLSILILYLILKPSQKLSSNDAQDVDKCRLWVLEKVIEPSVIVDMLKFTTEPIANVHCLVLHTKAAVLIYFGIKQSVALAEELNSLNFLRALYDAEALSADLPLDTVQTINALLDVRTHLIQLSIQIALQLTATCVNLPSKSSPNDVTSISALPFRLLQNILNTPTPRNELMKILLSTDNSHSNNNKSLSFILQVVVKLLRTFAKHPTVSLNTHEIADADKRAQVAPMILTVLLSLFDTTTTEKMQTTSELVARELHLVSKQLLPAVLSLLRIDSGVNTIELALKFLATLLCKKSQLNVVENLRAGFLQEIELLKSILMLIQSLSNISTTLEPMIQIIGCIVTIKQHDSLENWNEMHKIGIAKCLSQLLSTIVSWKGQAAWTDHVIVGILETVYLLLLRWYKTLQELKKLDTQQDVTEHRPTDLNFLVMSGSIILHLCSVNASNITPNMDLNNTKTQCGKVCDWASRCLTYLSQIFGEELNQVLFPNYATESSIENNEFQSNCHAFYIGFSPINKNDNFCLGDVKTLRLMLTLKNCIRSQYGNKLTKLLDINKENFERSNEDDNLPKLYDAILQWATSVHFELNNADEDIPGTNKDEKSLLMHNRIRKAAIDILHLLNPNQN